MAPYAAARAKENPRRYWRGQKLIAVRSNPPLSLYQDICDVGHAYILCPLYEGLLVRSPLPWRFASSVFKFLSCGHCSHLSARGTLYGRVPNVRYTPGWRVHGCSIPYSGAMGNTPPRRCARRSRRVAVPLCPTKYARPAGRLQRPGRLGSLANSYWYQGNPAPGYAAKLR